MKLSKSFRATRNDPHGQPSFATSGRRVGAADKPEPSSPKVTCIGQVRVKSKRRGRLQHRRSTSQRRTGEGSFRRAEQLQEERKNHRWVHLPFSGLRAFGSEFNFLLFPCTRGGCYCCNFRIFKNGCCYDDNVECENGGCGVVLNRWLVCGGRRCEIEPVVRSGDAGEEERMSVGSWGRKHVFDDIEVRNGRIEVQGRSLDIEEEEKRIRICIPPKNALLIMRCRSDPTRMAALANRHCNWEYTNSEDIVEEAEEEEEESNVEEGSFVWEKGPETVFEDKMEAFLEQDIVISLNPFEEEEIQNKVKPMWENNFEEEGKAKNNEEQNESNMSSFEALLDQENLDNNLQEKGEKCYLSSLAHSEKEQNDIVLSKKDEEDEPDKPTLAEVEKQELIKSWKVEETERSNQLESSKEEESKRVLPDCLLLMMCEPKLSMEVSKETWVRGADFIRWLPERRRKATKADDGCDLHQARGRPPKRPVAGPPSPPARKNGGPPHQSPRLSCSLPAAAGKEPRVGPFALTKCKSEPTRTAAAKLAPESCSWKDAVG